MNPEKTKFSRIKQRKEGSLKIKNHAFKSNMSRERGGLN